MPRPTVSRMSHVHAGRQRCQSWLCRGQTGGGAKGGGRRAGARRTAGSDAGVFINSPTSEARIFCLEQFKQKNDKQRYKGVPAHPAVVRQRRGTTRYASGAGRDSVGNSAPTAVIGRGAWGWGAAARGVADGASTPAARGRTAKLMTRASACGGASRLSALWKASGPRLGPWPHAHGKKREKHYALFTPVPLPPETHRRWPSPSRPRG